MNGENAIRAIDFFWHIYVPIGLWLLAIVVLLILLVNKFTFGKWTPEYPNPYEGETLSVPRGVFRGILTLTLLFVAVLMEVWNLEEGRTEENILEFLNAFKMMIAFYFGAKVAHHVTSNEKHKAKIKAGVLASDINEPLMEGDPSLFEDPQSAG